MTDTNATNADNGSVTNAADNGNNTPTNEAETNPVSNNFVAKIVQEDRQSDYSFPTRA